MYTVHARLSGRPVEIYLISHLRFCYCWNLMYFGYIADDREFIY